MDKYLYLFRLSLATTFKNYKALLGLCLFLVTCLIIFSKIWDVIPPTSGAVHLPVKHLLWYIAFNEWVFVSLSDIQETMTDDLKTGRLAYLLTRPLSYLGSAFCEGTGTFVGNSIILGGVCFGFTYLLAGPPPCSPLIFCLLLGIGLLAGAVATLFLLLTGLSAFWLQTAEPCYWIFEKSLFALGGLMIPLHAYPERLQTIVCYTPFPAILGDRSFLTVHFDAYKALSVTLSLIFWAVFACTALFFVYRKGLADLNTEGG